jgi:hypothetical protein
LTDYLTVSDAYGKAANTPVDSQTTPHWSDTLKHSMLLPEHIGAQSPSATKHSTGRIIRRSICVGSITYIFEIPEIWACHLKPLSEQLAFVFCFPRRKSLYVVIYPLMIRGWFDDEVPIGLGLSISSSIF